MRLIGGYYRIVCYRGRPFISLGPFPSRKAAEQYGTKAASLWGLDPVLAYMRPDDAVVFEPGRWFRRKER